MVILSVEKKQIKKRQCYHTDISWWGRNSFSSEVKITRGVVWIKIFKKWNLKIDLINLTETNHQINMTSGHPVSSNDSFKMHLNAKSFKMLLHCRSCAKQADCVLVSVARVM